MASTQRRFQVSSKPQGVPSRVQSHRKLSPVIPRPQVQDFSAAGVTADDLTGLACAVGLKPAVNDLAPLADRVNQLVAETAHAAMIEPSPAMMARSQWCSAAAAMADRLASAVINQGGTDEWAPWDAMELVQPGLLTDEGTATQLRELLSIAVPRPQHDDINADFLLMLARLAPGLHAFALVAETASVHWRGKARPGVTIRRAPRW